MPRPRGRRRAATPGAACDATGAAGARLDRRHRRSRDRSPSSRQRPRLPDRPCYQGARHEPAGREVFDRGALVGAQIYAQGDWYRIGTAMFLHASLLHLTFNMLALSGAGRSSSASSAPGASPLVYFVSGLAGLGRRAALQRPFAVTVGASGAIYGIFGALLVLEYRATGSFAGPALGLIVVNLPVVRDPEHLDGAATSAGSSAARSRPSRCCTSSTRGRGRSAPRSSA